MIFLYNNIFNASIFINFKGFYEQSALATYYYAFISTWNGGERPSNSSKIAWPIVISSWIGDAGFTVKNEEQNVKDLEQASDEKIEKYF